jgi:hypothetical protein
LVFFPVKPAHKKNTKTVRDRNTVADIAEAGADGDDDDEECESGEGESEHEDKDWEGGGDQRTHLPKWRYTHSVYFTTEAVKWIELKENTRSYCNVSSWGACR